ncbi:ribonuclease HI [Desulfomarina sp.]
MASGRECGVFADWPAAQKQVKGFAGAKYKGFMTRAEAEKWLKNPVYEKKRGDGARGKKNGYQESEKEESGVTIYTDGGCINNPGPGGYGAVIIEKGEQKELSGGFRLTTNNRMEMMAAIVALRHVVGRTETICLFSDSSYLVNAVNKGWLKKWRSNGWKKADGGDVLNADLWREILQLLENTRVHFHWVKGHAGNPLNERCDRLAVTSARKKNLPVDEGYEQAIN